MPNITKFQHEKLLAAAAHAKAETARADHAERGALEAQAASRLNVLECAELRKKIANMTDHVAEAHKMMRLRESAVLQLSLRLAAYGDPREV